jgi:TRAP-type C4-dicarboxylate transport system permease small subunit
MFKSMKNRLFVMAAVSCTAFLSFVGLAGATSTYDLNSIGTSVTDQVSNGVTTALPIGGAILGLFIAWKVVKRLTRG